MELIDIKGISTKRTAMLNSAGVYSVVDLLNHYPYKYYDFSSIDEFDTGKNTHMTVSGTVVTEAKNVFVYKLNYVIAKIKDSKNDKLFSAVWYNQPYIKNALKLNEKYVFYGKINTKKQFVVERYFSLDSFEDSMIVPVYKSVSGLGNKTISSAIKQILCEYELQEYLPKELAGEKLIDAYKKIHFPASFEDIEKGKSRVALEDMSILAAGKLSHESKNQNKTQKYEKKHIDEFIKICPFALTNDQKKAIDEISNDMTSVEPMNRLLLGDVGSGKTIVAIAMCYLAAKSGYQSVFVAPTEILAKQHYQTLLEVLKGQKINISILHSKLTTREKNKIMSDIKNHKTDIVVGTHSVFSENVVFANLSAIVTDEQHRFGVAQRASIAQKSNAPDVLIMSATPIPRSLSLVFFGGLKTSKLLERPMGASQIKTHILRYNKLDALHKYLEAEITTNNANCFVIVPRIDDDDKSELYSIEQVSAMFSASDFFKDKYRVIHGKQSSEEQEKIVSGFKNLDFPVLVATTIVEVGIDVPSASIMVIYDADRFGFATLHQLRGRIGRDGKEGHCFCLTNTNNDTAINRLKFFKSHNSGFEIAEEDFKTRGAGTIIGTKQHGYSEILSSKNFSVDEYKKAERIVKKLSTEEKLALKTEFKKRFGDLFKKIIMN